ncbi:Pyridine nucleotide-disulfide oxidoreductase, FAD/NAD(P)-binding domain protein, partial [Tolypocladium paradoxum]
MPKTVVVLGGSLGGLAVAHRLLKYTLPHEPDLRNSHFYWNIASVRAVIPRAVKDEALLQPIAPGLAQYPPGSVEFVVGAATGLDARAKTVR